MSAHITIDGVRYRVVESLPYHQAGMPAKVVLSEGHECIAVKRGGKWTWWTIGDRLQKRGGDADGD